MGGGSTFADFSVVLQESPEKNSNRTIDDVRNTVGICFIIRVSGVVGSAGYT